MSDLKPIWGIGIVETYNGSHGLIRGPEGVYRFFRAAIKSDDVELLPGHQVIFHVHPYGKLAHTVLKMKAQINPTLT